MLRRTWSPYSAGVPATASRGTNTRKPACDRWPTVCGIARLSDTPTRTTVRIPRPRRAAHQFGVRGREPPVVARYHEIAGRMQRRGDPSGLGPGVQSRVAGPMLRHTRAVPDGSPSSGPSSVACTTVALEVRAASSRRPIAGTNAAESRCRSGSIDFLPRMPCWHSIRTTASRAVRYRPSCQARCPTGPNESVNPSLPPRMAASGRVRVPM